MDEKFHDFSHSKYQQSPDKPTCHLLPSGTGEFQGLPVDGGDEGGLDLQPDAVLHEQGLGVDDGVHDGDDKQSDHVNVAPPFRFIRLNISVEINVQCLKI